MTPKLEFMKGKTADYAAASKNGTTHDDDEINGKTATK